MLTLLHDHLHASLKCSQDNHNAMFCLIYMTLCMYNVTGLIMHACTHFNFVCSARVNKGVAVETVHYLCDGLWMMKDVQR